MIRALLVLLILLPCPVLAQSQGHSTLLSVNEGLSQGMVFDILQARDGFLWIATKDGLNRYDGYRFEIFTSDPFDPFSLSNNEIWRLFEDSKGRIWMTHMGGIDIFVPETNRFFHLEARHFPDFNWGILLFTETADGTIWLAGNGNLCNVKIPENALLPSKGAFPEFEIQQIEPPLDSSGKPAAVHAVYSSPTRGLLVSADTGLYGFDPATNQYRSLLTTDLAPSVLGEDKAGRLWLIVFPESSGGPHDDQQVRLWAWSENQKAPRTFPAYDNFYCRMDKDGYLWLWYKRIVHKWHPDHLLQGGAPEFEWLNDAPYVQNPAYSPKTLHIDQSGIAWLGTNGFGMVKINPVKPKFTSYLSASSQRLVVEDPQQRLFTIMDCSKLYASARFERSVNNPWLLYRPDYTWLLAAAFDNSGQCWYSFGSGILCRFDAQSGAERQIPWKGFGLVKGKNGKLYAVAEDGLLEFDPATEQQQFFPFGRPTFHFAYDACSKYLYCASSGTLWIFGLKGLVRAQQAGAGFQFDFFVNNPANPASLSENTVLSVAEDPLEPGRYLWVGTKGGGLNRLDLQTGTFRHFKTAQGLPDNVVYGILPDDSGHIWLSTNKGLCRFHVRDESTKNFTVADGLQDNEFNRSSYLKLHDGTLIFGGVNGLTAFRPDSLSFNEHRPQTHIVGLSINNERRSIYFSAQQAAEQPLVFTYSENFLTLEFAALEFSNPAQNHYRYQLIRHSGLGSASETKWIDLGDKNNVQFANLSPGRYTFRVLGSNNDGLWSDRPAELKFSIRPPWWASWWAWLGYLLLASAIIWRLYRFQLQRRLYQQEAFRLRELDMFKNRFFTNITHEFRTPLTVILGASAQLEQYEGQRVRSKAGLIRRSGENLLRLINQLLDLAKLESNTLQVHYEHGDAVHYLRYIVGSLQSLAGMKQVQLQMQSSLESLHMDYDPDRLVQIVYNLLSNAIKFTPAGGAVSLQLTVEKGPGGDHLRLAVSDNGVGIPEADLAFIFDRFYQSKNLEKARAGGTGIGLALTKELVQVLGGTIAVQSVLNRGTTFTVLLPVRHEANQPVEHAGAAGPETAGNGTAETGQAVKPVVRPGVSLLIIEDNPEVVAYLRNCLEKKFALDFAFNGSSGVEKALETIPDLIVSDVMMPEKDGFEVCEILKNDVRTSHIPVVLLTAKAGAENRIAGLKRGADAYLTKPFYEEELLAVLNNLMAQQRKWQLKYGQAAMLSEVAETPDAEHEPEQAFLGKFRAVVEAQLSNADFDMLQLEKALAMSRSQIFRKTKALTGKSPSQFIRSIRLHHGRRLLQTTGLTVSEIAYEVGFATVKYFSDAFLEEFGERPTAVRG
ncbi:MAG: response regulator [Lewinellaceae bacterium]|nr:response regulator [Lewinellaceae bacterium]